VKYYGLIFWFKYFRIKSSDEFKAFERKSLEKGEKVTKWSDVLNKENI